MAFSLDSITNSKGSSPPRILIHGMPKVGKSTFFSKAPNTLYMQIEDGLKGLSVDHTPVMKTFTDVIEVLDVLLTQKHEYKTLVIDSADWLEQLIHQQVCENSNVKSIAKADGGYGNGFISALNIWRVFLDKLNLLNTEKKMIIGVICHSSVIKFNDPETEPYDIFSLKLHSSSKGTGSGNLLQEWSDVIGFASKEISVTNKGTDQQKIVRATELKGKGGSKASHKLHLVGEPAFVAGNRYSLPKCINLTWPEFETAFTAATK